MVSSSKQFRLKRTEILIIKNVFSISDGNMIGR